MDKRLNKKDILIMTVMTFVYLVVALINLGSFEAPQTGWEPERLNESFVVDFGREVTIDKIMLFGGLGHAWGCFGSLEFLAYENDEYVSKAFVDMRSVFKWHYATEAFTTSKVKVVNHYLRTDDEEDKNRYFKAEYREIGFFSGDELLSGFEITQVQANEGLEKLFDEQSLVPDRPTYLNGTYFDEIYFPRTALEQLEQRDILYENTHPPLGKTLLAVGISIFGMNPFGWRIMGTLFGAALIPLMYLMGKRLFKDSFWAFFCAFLMMFDFMHFTQTRLATIDSYTVFFVMATYLCMLEYYDSESYKKGFFRSILPLLLSGIFLGLGIATKWIVGYAAFGLALLFFLSRGYEYSTYNNELNLRMKGEDHSFKSNHLNAWLGKYFFLTCFACVFLFVIIPFALYALSFIPIHYNANRGLIPEVIASVKHMYEYHKGVVQPHPYSSSWYAWPLIFRPIFYFAGSLLPEGMGSSIASFGNPIVWWGGFISVILAIIILFIKPKKHGAKPDSNKLILFAIIGYFSQYVPWIVAPRKLTFIYHYFSCVPFLILLYAVVLRYLERNGLISRRVTYVIMALTFILFVIYYPVLSGLEVPRAYLNGLRILPGWDW